MSLESLNVEQDHFRFLANRANALKSTGPRTERGKAVSSANAIKHGFRSTHPLLDENLEELREARERFLGDLKPRGEVALTICDLAFRQKRQLERVLAAEDAATEFRLGEMETLIRTDRERFIAEATAKFEAEPFEGQAMLRVCIDGVDYLQTALLDMERAIEAGNWEPTLSARLLAIEENVLATDEVLDHAVLLSDEIRNVARVLRESCDGDGPSDQLTRNMARAQLEKFRNDLAAVRKAILARIKDAYRRLGDERLSVRSDEIINLRRLMDLAKFDLSQAAQLRRRYISKAQADFMRALLAAIKATGWKMSTTGSISIPQAVAPPKRAAAPNARRSAGQAPNEPVSGRDDRAGRRDPEAPPTDVPGRETA